MLRKWNRFLSFILAIALIATTFHSDLATIRVFADGDEQDVQVEEPVEEPVVEEPVVEEPVVEEPEEPAPAPEEVYQEPVEEPAAPEEVTTPEEPAAPVEPAAPETPETQEPKEDKPETPEAEVVEPEEEEIEVEPEEETPENKRTLSDEEIAAIIDDLTEEGLAALESEYNAEDFAAIKSAFEAKMKELEEEEELEEKLVTVSYKASLGGQVSRSSETVDINAEEVKFEGSTATAVNKYYQFVAWVDADGNTVCSEAEFIPSDIEEDVTFTANFMKLSEMPAQSFSGSAGGMNVSVSADEGIFPEGTTMHVSAISDDEALDAAKEAVGEAAQQAKGVDITFRNSDGEEIEPADARYVHVSISLATELEGDSFSVVHKDDSGNADVIASASADGAEFEANQFSVYIVVSTGDEIVDPGLQIVEQTYIFTVDGAEFKKQIIKNGEELENPGVPTLEANQVFRGWFYKVGDAPVSFGPKTDITAEKTVECYAKIETTFTLTFIGVDGEVVEVKEKAVVGTEDADITTGDVQVTPLDIEEAHRGWTVTPGSTEIKDPVNARKYDKVYPVIEKAHWITFVENDGIDHGGASYTGPVAVFPDQLPIDVKPENPTRKGYIFGGWYEHQGDGDGKVVGDEFAWEDELDKDITLYAKWVPAQNTEYTVIIWQQKISDSKDASEKSYDYKTSFTQTGTTGAYIDSSIGNNYRNQGDEGFHYDRCEVIRKKGDQDLPVTEIRAKGDTIVNVYFDRNLMTINFYTWQKKSATSYSYEWKIADTYTGLYGQTLAQNNYTWPTDHSWYNNHNNQGGTSGTRLTYLNAFLFKGLSGVSQDGKTLNQYGSSVTGAATIRFFTQNIDETWPEDPAYETQADSVKFSITDKYNGFKAYGYRTLEDDEWSELTILGDKQSDGTYAAVPGGYTALEVYFQRLKYDITFIENYRDNLTTLKTVTGVPYEATISAYQGQAPVVPETDENKPGYKFDGWFEDVTGHNTVDWGATMPAANMVIYGCHVPVKFTVTLDAQGGTLYEGQAAEFTLDYGDTVNKASLKNTTKPGYSLAGWYENGKPYGYGGVTHDTHLVARWRESGTIKVVYDAGEHGSNPPKDNYNYSSTSSVVVGTRPTVEDGYTFLGWTIVGDNDHIVYYPSGCFAIEDDYIVNETVTLVAQYIKTGGDAGLTTYITYKPNGGNGSDVTVALPGDPDLLINEKVIALTAEQCEFTRSGYEFKGWSRTGGDDATVEINAGQVIAADNKDLPNELYAVWERITGKYIVEYYKGKVTDSTDLAHYLGSVGPYTVAADTVLTENDVNLNLRKPDNGYQDGEFYGDTTVYAGDDNVIYVLYKPIKVTVTVEGTHETYTYNGQTRKVSGFRVTGITADTGYQASYVTYTGETEASATHVVEEGNANEKALDINLFKNTSSLFDDDSVEFVLGEVTSNKVTITPATITINTPSASKVYDGTPLTAEGTIGGLVNNETATFTTTGTVTYPSEGEVQNTYSLAFDKTAKQTDYTVEATVGKLQVFENDKVKITVTTEGGTFTYDGQSHGATVTYSDIPDGYTVAEAASSATATNVSEGTVPATADKLVIKNGNDEDVTDLLDIEYKDGSITITPAPITIFTPTASKVYDGEPLTAEGEMTGLVNGETATFTTTGSQLAVGSSDNTYSLEWNGTATESNYQITSKTIGTLTVKKYENEIVVTTTGGEFTYDGTAHGATVTYSDMPKGYRVAEASSDATAKDVSDGTVTAKADHFKIVNAQDEDVTGDLTIRYVNGSIKILPAQLTITTDSAEKTYDGQPLTAPGRVTGLVNNETVSFEVTGTITYVGSVPNSYEFAWDGTADESNYTVEKSIGTLTVKEFAGTIEVITTGEIAEYDGKAHGATVAVNGLPTGYSVGKAVSNATATDVTVTDVIADCDELVILNQDGEDVTNALTISKTPGFIRITPAKVIITVEGDKRIYKYSGYEQKAEGFAITDISNDLYSEDMLSFTGDAIAKGKLPNTYMMNLKAEQFTNSDTNFEVEFVIDDGYLTIEPLGPGEKFRITAIAYDATREYTGNYYDGFGYELTGEGPTQGLIADAIDRVENFFRSTFGGITADAAGEGGDPTVTINGIEFTVRGLYVPTRERNAGEYALPIEGTMRVYDGADDVTDQFELVERRTGTLTISKMVINLTSGSGTKVYDGTALTNSTITSDKNWGVGDTVAYNITGTQTQIGESDNLFTAVGTNGTDLDRNYIINYTYGRLIVTSAPAPTPTPTPDPTPAPTPGGTTIADAPTPTAPAPAPAPAPAAVLGATRDTDGAAVLGARRGRTEDTANLPGRIMAALIAAAVAAALLLTKKKESEEEDQK